MTGVPQQLLGDLAAILAAAGIADAGNEAASIVAAAIRQTGPAEYVESARAMTTERAKGTPLAYLTGQAPFMGVDLFTAPGALVPREETELLGRTALGILKELRSPNERRLIDMCCGSGNLACGIAWGVPGLRVWASDLTDGAMTVARANVERLKLADRVTVLQGDLFVPLADLGLEGTIDMVVCNPPYISSGKLAKEAAALLSHEPREAFDGGPYGVSIFQRVVRDALRFLKPEGWLIFEIGAGQDKQVTMIVNRANGYQPAELVNDAEGRPRVILCRTKV